MNLKIRKKIILLYSLIIFIVFVSLVKISEAKDLYVDNSDPNCSDAFSYGINDESNPWCSIGRASWGGTSYGMNALEAAQAGDVVLISEGVYWTNGNPNNGRYNVALNPANSGTLSNPIIFRGVDTVEIRVNNGYRQPTIGSNDRNYIVWDNFLIYDYYQGSTSDTGPVVFYESTGGQLLNSVIVGHPGEYYHGYEIFGGNYCGLRLDYTNSMLIKNNKIYNFTGGANEAGIMTYDSNDNIIEQNELYSNGCGIFLKGVHPGHTQENNIIRYNLLYNIRTGGGIRALDATDTLIYQNIIHTQEASNAVGLWAGFTGSIRSRFVNNTVYGIDRGISPQGDELDDVQFLNNIIVNSAVSAIYNWDQANPSTHDANFNRNCYYNNRYTWQNEGGTSLDFSQFQGYSQEANGIESNPLFVNAGTGNFKLQVESPALTLGRTITEIHGSNGQTIPAGAYITGDEIIGLISEINNDIIPPSAPSGLAVS